MTLRCWWEIRGTADPGGRKKEGRKPPREKDRGNIGQPREQLKTKREKREIGGRPDMDFPKGLQKRPN